ncbi:polyprenyl synthetase family protein [Rosettibacter firmus]|uniref:polyprenyl synthetase family protein n=1 Tax=Rosettibacter firmus TaxID=3111522 RepID=UPI00336BFFAA
MKTIISKETFQKIYQKELNKIEKRLNKLLIKREPRSLYEPCNYAITGGGKRIRPLLVLLSAKATGGSFNDVYNASIAVELFHNFTLVHDDIMDNSDIRRGRLSLHKKFDISTAILTGDNLIALAYESLLKDCKNNTKEIVSTFTRGIIEVCEGQSLDKEFELRDNVSIDDYKKMIFKKTAALAQMCCSIGAKICNAENLYIKILENYGKNLGMAFQIQDDLLDIIGEEKKFGKRIGSDLIEGKKTYLFLKALEKSKGSDKKKLIDVMKNRGIKPDEVKLYKMIYEKYNILEDAKKEIINYTNQALKNLSKLPDKEGSDLLYWLAYSLIGRSK